MSAARRRAPWAFRRRCLRKLPAAGGRERTHPRLLRYEVRRDSRLYVDVLAGCRLVESRHQRAAYVCLYGTALLGECLLDDRNCCHDPGECGRVVNGPTSSTHDLLDDVHEHLGLVGLAHDAQLGGDRN